MSKVPQETTTGLRGMHIGCANQPRWPGIILSGEQQRYELTKNHFAGLAHDTVLNGIFHDETDFIVVELGPESFTIRAEGSLRVSPADRTKKSSGQVTLPRHKRSKLNFASYTLNIQSHPG